MLTSDNAVSGVLEVDDSGCSVRAFRFGLELERPPGGSRHASGVRLQRVCSLAGLDGVDGKVVVLVPAGKWTREPGAVSQRAAGIRRDRSADAAVS